MKHTITVIPGDGIGPEVIDAMRRCVDATGVDIQWEEALAGGPALTKYGSLLPEETLASVRKNKVAIKGPIITPIGSGFRSVNVAIRQALGLFACVRPAQYFSGVPLSRPGTNIIIVRENSEDLYAGIEFYEGAPGTDELRLRIESLSEKRIRPDSAISIKPISRTASEKICRFSFNLARNQRRNKISCIHKANIMKATDGLFLEVFRNVAKEYPDIESGDVIVDNLCMQLVKVPCNFDVLVLPNLYGDIVSDLCAGLIGGLGIAPGANIGDEYAVFEPVHGSAPKYTGKNKVNPTATILSGVLMLRHINEKEAADVLEHAVRAVIEEGTAVTYDLKTNRNDPGAVGTREMAAAIVKRIKG